MQIGPIGTAIAGAAAGAQAVFEYNRGNFKYDREMRQKTEFKTREWRSAAVDLWRDDIREIIGLTERKMDMYLLVGTLQLGMCVVLFCEGRLEPGTPPWLMHLYMLTTSGAFLYLLMSVWLAMHASIVAQCSEVRLLTQFVRLPIPSWAELQDMRTFAQTYETLDTQQIMRIPFSNHATAADITGGDDSKKGFGASFGSGKPSSTIGALKDSSAAERAIDPWLKEAHADDREGLYELIHMPIARRRHIHLARRAASQYQAFDAFTRTAISFGSHQLLNAVGYYTMGYCTVQDGAPWPAICVAIIMVATSTGIAQLDFSMTRNELVIARILLITGPLLSSVMGAANAVKLPCTRQLVLVCTPLASLAHALWLLFSLKVLGVRFQENGVMLPTKFRAVLYLDVFGWFNSGSAKPSSTPQGGAISSSLRRGLYTQMPRDNSQQFSGPDAFEVVSPADQLSDGSSEAEETTLSELQEDIREQISLWRNEKVQPLLSGSEKSRVDEFIQRYEQATGEDIDRLSRQPYKSKHFPHRNDAYHEDPDSKPWLKLQGFSDIGTQADYLFQPETGNVFHPPEAIQERTPADDASVASEGTLEREDSKDVLSLTMAEEDIERFLVRQQEERHKKPRKGSARPKAQAGSWLDCTEDANVRGAIADDKAGELAFDDGEEGEDGESDDEEDQSIKEDIRRRRHGHESYCPQGRLAHHPHRTKLYGEPDEDVKIGYGDLKPGVLPWQIFRGATLLMALLYVLGSWLPAILTPDMLVTPLTILAEGEEEGVEEEDLSQSETEEKAIRKDFKKLPKLTEGELVHAIWPVHSGFEPKALTCDPMGQHILVADDFGLYASVLTTAKAEDLAQKHSPDAVAKSSPTLPFKGLRGHGKAKEPAEEDDQWKDPQGTHLAAEFMHQPHCAAIEGHGLQDVGLACAYNDNISTDCRAFVLHGEGQEVSECGLHLEPTKSFKIDQLTAVGAKAFAAAASTQKTGRFPSWQISSTWLHGEDENGMPEYVDSLAVSSRCLQPFGDKGKEMEFKPELMDGCMVVGTSLGRIVELRSHYFNRTQLVPEKAVQDWIHPVGQGSLHIFPEGVVIALHGKYATVSAFDAKVSAAIGEWRLPVDNVKWMNLCGGGGHLFLLGRSMTDGVARLYRFKLPEKLQDATAGARSRHLSTRHDQRHPEI